MRSRLLPWFILGASIAAFGCGDSVESVTVTPDDARLVVTDTLRLSASALAGDGNALTDQTITWESEDPDIASVDEDGLVTAEADGVANIVATADGVSGTAEVTVFTPAVLVVSNFAAGNEWVLDAFSTNLENVTVDTLDVDAQTPGVAFLRQYDVVLLFEDGLFTNATNVGDSVAAYYAAGGNVVLGEFYWQERSDNQAYTQAVGWGALEAVDPFLGPEGSEYRPDSVDLGTVVAHPMTAGLTRLWVDEFHGGVETRPGTTVLMRWSDACDLCTAAGNTPALGFRTGSQGQRIVGFGVAPDYGHWNPDGFSPDFYLVWGNVLRWAAAGGPGPTVSAAAPVWRVQPGGAPARTAIRIGGGRRGTR